MLKKIEKKSQTVTFHHRVASSPVTHGKLFSKHSMVFAGRRVENKLLLQKAYGLYMIAMRYHAGL